MYGNGDPNKSYMQNMVLLNQDKSPNKEFE